MPPIDKDYCGWLKYQKQKWKIQKQARIRRRQLFGDRRMDSGDQIGNMFRNQAELLFINTWQLIQLQETDVPGEVRAFVLIDKKIHALKFIIPRTLYLNLKTDNLPDVTIEGCQVERVMNHTLPNGHPSVHLFKMTMPESIYRSEAQKIRLLQAHQSVEGLYEQNVPLDVRAMLELGNVCTFDESQRGALGKGLDQGFDLTVLRQVHKSEPYLQHYPLRYIFMCHIKASDRQIFAIFSPGKAQAYFIVFNRGRDEQGMPNLDSIHKELYASRSEESPEILESSDIDYPQDLQFRTTTVT